MDRFKIIYLVLITSLSLITCEEPTEKIATTQKLQQSEPYNPTWMSRIASWLFPFGGKADTTPAEGQFAAPQYLPPGKPGKSCNPCNSEPWIPMATNYGQKTIVNFVPPASSSHLGSVQPSQPVFRPRPDKLNYGLPQTGPTNFGKHFADYSEIKPFMVPPPLPNKLPVTYLRPVMVPIDMRPPPISGSYHSLPTIASNLPPQPPPPSDSYGSRVVGPNSNYQINPEYLPLPVPLPNLSNMPVLPIHDHQIFKSETVQDEYKTDQIPQHIENYEITKSSSSGSNVQVIPSIQVADYLASIEHPINVIQSPIVDLSVKEITNGNNYGESKLSENPIVVEDAHAAASAINVTYENDQVKRGNDQQLAINAFNSPNGPKPETYRSQTDINPLKDFLQSISINQSQNITPPPFNFNQWHPTWESTIQTSMVPPPVINRYSNTTTKKPKQIQIIVPYIMKPFTSDVNQARKVPPPLPTKSYSTLVPVYMPPLSTEQSIWSKFMEDFKLTESKKLPATTFVPQTTTQVSNIMDLLKGLNTYPQENLPFDVISLQNNIDDWTQSAYQKDNIRSKLAQSKKIPEEYFTVKPNFETTTNKNHFDYEPAGSNDIETNLIFEETTEIPTTTTKAFPLPFSTKDQKTQWEIAHVTVSPVTKEKVYIVTPQPTKHFSLPPKIKTNTTKFLIRVESDRNSRSKLNETNKGLTVVFSEWPHIINNLQTTTTPPSTSRHPLFGLMDLSSYTPPPNSTVQTISGHSKVITVVTPANAANKYTENEEMTTTLPQK